MNQVLKKLRKQNLKEYILYMFCTMFSVAIVSSYALLLFSPTVLEVLPVGGDSRKQAFGIFAIVCIGCLAFSMYSSLLFYQKKQKELGIMIALGGNRRKLYTAIVKEYIRLNIFCLLFGGILAFPINKGIWGIFQCFIDSPEMVLRLNIYAFLIAFFMAVAVFIVTICIIYKVIFKMDLLDVMKAEHKNEVVKDLPVFTGVLGVFLLMIGGCISYFAPGIYIDIFQAYPPEWLNLLYLFPLTGVYLTILNRVIGSSKRSKNYESKMISKSITKFQGKQTVNCMLVIALLMGGGCFAAFYTPITMTAFERNLQAKEWDYEYTIPQNRKALNEKQIEEIVKKHGGNIQERKDFSVLLAARDGMQEMEEGRKIRYKYNPRMSTIYLMKQSDFEDFTKIPISVEENTYFAITDEEESVFYDSEVTIFTNMETRQEYEVVFGGCLHNEDLLLENSRLYVISDVLFQEMENSLSKEWKQTVSFFKVSQDSFELGKDLYNAFYQCFEKEDMIFSGYDKVSAISAYEAGEEYWADDPAYSFFAELDKNSPEFQREWIYFPFFKIMVIQNTLRNYAVFFMLFIYVVIVALTSSWLIAYTRCITVGMHQKYVFEALEKLGASEAFRMKELKKQISAIYRIPTIIGLVVVYFLFVLILYGNDGGRFTSSEIVGLIICFGIEVLVGMITYLCYRIALQKVKRIVF